ncbi:MAG: TonB-dependent receptor [Candidatus Handelsmanbacteria bacterium]|nr:TonB-dependent receptor [Candidatus Handelsmanbacteria bacterium]
MRGFLMMMALLTSALAGAQIPARLEGVVVDDQSGEPLAGVNLRLEGQGLEVASDSLGRFGFRGVVEAEVLLSASHVGYWPFRQRVAPGRAQGLRVALQARLLPGQEVEIRADRARERETPSAFSDLARPAIEARYHTQDLPLLLGELPGVYSYADAGIGMGYSYLKVRGFDQTGVGVMINGVPLNDPEDHQVYWVNLPDLATSLEDIQLQRGVAPSLYGASAIGGAVNLVTSAQAGEPGVRAALGTGSYGTRKLSLDMNSGLIEKGLALHARFSRMVSDGYRDRSGVEQWAYFIGASRYGERSSFQVNLFGGPQEVEASWDAVAASVLAQDRRANFTQDADHFNQPHYQLIHEWQPRAGLRLSNTLFQVHGEGYYEGYRDQRSLRAFGLPAIQTREENLFGADSLDYYLSTEAGGQTVLARDGQGRYSLLNTDLIRRKWVDKDQYGWLGRLEWQHGRGQLSAGAQVYDFSSKHRGWVKWAAALPGGVSPDQPYYAYRGTQRAGAFYLRELWQVDSRLNLSGEVQAQYKRYRFRHQEAGNFTGEERNTYRVTNLFFNPKLGLNYNLSETLNLYLSAAQASQEPADTEYYDAFDGPDDLGADPLFARADTVVDGGAVQHLVWRDPLIDPEKVWDFETGAGYQRGGRSARLNLYWMDFRNEIIRYGQVDDDNVPVRGNADRTVHRGLELALSGPVAGRWSLDGNLTLSQNYYADFNSPYWDDEGNVVVFDYGDNTLPLFPGRLANLRLAYQYRGGALGLQLQHVGKQYLDNTEDEARTIDPYRVLNAVLSQEVGWTGTGARVALHLNNLLGEKYETSGYFDGERYLYTAAGRHYFLGITLAW